MTEHCIGYTEFIARKEEYLRKTVQSYGMAFGPDRTEEVRKIRNELSRYRINERNNQKSLHLNKISRACHHCSTGEGATTFILGLACNRECYFCTNRNQHNYEEMCRKTNDVVAEFQQFCATSDKVYSVALTGGEPLLYPDKCLEFYSHVKTFDESIHTRLYSNGDLATASVLESLAPYLDEIRIGVKMETHGHFDLQMTEKILRLCKQYLSQVTVEVPVLPNGYQQMIDLIELCNQQGIFSINLLEFLFPWQSPEKYIERGFQIKQNPYAIIYNYSYAGGLPIDGSEVAALRCLLFAAENNFQTGVHYCSLENKLTSQIYQQNLGVQPAPTEIHSGKDYYFKSLKLQGNTAIRAHQILQKNHGLNFLFDEGLQQLEFHPKDISVLKESGIAEAILSYALVEKDGEQKVMREVHYETVNLETFDPSAL